MCLTRTVKIGHEHGLHARPAAEVVKLVMPHQGDVLMLVGEKSINLKSIVSVMAAGITTGQIVTLRATGAGADDLLERLADYLERGGDQ